VDRIPEKWRWILWRIFVTALQMACIAGLYVLSHSLVACVVGVALCAICYTDGYVAGMAIEDE
jgi:hypothetical protein